jgi:hypothetical protein
MSKPVGRIVQEPVAGMAIGHDDEASNAPLGVDRSRPVPPAERLQTARKVRSKSLDPGGTSRD